VLLPATEVVVLATVPSATLLGARGRPVTVEVHVANGLPGFTIVGLPDEACRESRDRVRAALLSSDLPWPQRRVTVNLAPSGVRKGGAGLDLPIAVGVLVATELIPAGAAEGMAFIGELGLDGSIRRVPGMVPMADALGEVATVVAPGCVHEARLTARGEVRSAECLRALVAALRGDEPWPGPPPCPPEPPLEPAPDLAEVRGQASARQAVEVAAAGGHHVLMLGAPGSGKTMLATRLVGLLPALTPQAALEVTMVHSAAGVALPVGGLVVRPPLRAPHHTASIVAMVGGGTASMRPGEASLAHQGVLVLDEMAEFHPSVLDGLRQPLEEGVIRVIRAKASVEFPSQFLLVGTMNPCPCGSGDPRQCTCGDTGRLRYLRRVSGPLLDRFDLRLEVQRPSVEELLGGPPAESTAVVAERVRLARQVMHERAGMLNADIPAHRLDELAPLTPAASRLLRRELEQNRLTGRGLHRVRRVARTLCDLAGDSTGRVDDERMRLALRLRIDPFERVRSAA
jgi:magnesium chelatase family protein